LAAGLECARSLEQLRPLLASLDALKPLSGVHLKAAAGEFESIRQALAATEPPKTLKATHDLFCTVCVLGALSATARLEQWRAGQCSGVERRVGGGERHDAGSIGHAQSWESHPSLAGQQLNPECQ